MIKSQFRIRIPEDRWIGEISRRYPGATFRLVSGVGTDDGTIQLGSVTAADTDEIVATVEDHPSVTGVEVLDDSGDTTVGRYETTESELYEFVEASTLPPEYPVVVRDGWAEWDLTGTRAELEEFRTWLDSVGATYELSSLVQAGEEGGLLTDRQREVLATAQRMGYLEVPRECTLVELADALAVDKSTVSEILRRAQGRIATWYLVGSDVEP